MSETILHENGSRKKYIEKIVNRKDTLIKRIEFMHGDAKKEAEKEIAELIDKLRKYGTGVDKVDRRPDKLIPMFGKRAYDPNSVTGHISDAYDTNGNKSVGKVRFSMAVDTSPGGSKKRFNEMIDKNSKHGSELQAAITKRGQKKSQNESIAVLLTEAALLLNEEK